LSVSEVSICNSALFKIGAEPILAFSDESKNSRICKAQYPVLRDEVLRSHPWNFAIARKELAKLVAVPVYEFESAFQLPTDVLRVLDNEANFESSFVEWQVEGDKVLSNDDTMKIKYIKRIVDVSKYDQNFLEVLAFRLAADFAYALVQSLSVQAQMFSAYQQFLRQARSFDAQEGALKQVRADEWFNSRF